MVDYAGEAHDQHKQDRAEQYITQELTDAMSAYLLKPQNYKVSLIFSAIWSAVRPYSRSTSAALPD